MKLKRILALSILAILGWFGITQGAKTAHAYFSQQQTLTRIPSLLGEVGNSDQVPNLAALKKAQQQLRETVGILEAIPAIPGFSHDRAQAELKKLRPLLEQITDRIAQEEKAAADLATALQLDQEAVELAKDAPHPLDVWQQAQEKWRQAIALLASIPANTFVSAQAKAGLESCRKNLQFVNQQWSFEARAVRDIETALRTAEQSIQALQNRPYQLTDLVNARNQWQRSLVLLRRIADITTVATDAQALTFAYETNLRKLEDAIVEVKNCQERFRLASSDTATSTLCGYEVSLDLETPNDVLMAQVDLGRGEDEIEVDEIPGVSSVAVSAATNYSQRYRLRSRKSSAVRSGSSGQTWVRGYTRSDGTSVQGHSRSSGRSSGFGSFRSGGASS